MRALAYLVVLGLVFYVVWRYLGRNAGPKAKLGPDSTNVREPETFAVHHHGKGQGMDIANTALKERTENLTRDLPGDTHKLKVPIPGRDVTKMSSPPPDASRYGDVKVAPASEPELPTTRGDMELAEDLLPEQPLRSGRVLDIPPADADRGRVLMFRGRPGAQSEAIIADGEDADVAFTPDAAWSQEMAEEVDWEGLNDPTPLPSHYTEEAIAALVRNPRSLYVYWERSSITDQNLFNTLGEDTYRRSTPCLRVTDVTPGADPGQLAGRTWLLDVSELDDHWFVHDGIEPDHTYEVSFGRRTADGLYIVLSHSEPVHTPHETPAPGAEGMLYRLHVGRPGEGSPQWR